MKWIRPISRILNTSKCPGYAEPADQSLLEQLRELSIWRCDYFKNMERKIKKAHNHSFEMSLGLA